ncbi:MAG: nucleoside triphosphate pyrophosphohydrolase [bacterium]
MESKSDTLSLRPLQDLVRRLRAPGGCPWDRAQSMGDLKQYLLEECYELLEAMDEPRSDELLEELGDLLFQIVFVAELAEEAGRFRFQEVLEGIHEKMVRRHPHVFGESAAADVDAVKRNWLRIKQQEGGGAGGGLLDSIPHALPALQKAYRMGQRAAQVGFDWESPAAVLEKVKEEIREIEGALQDRDPSKIREELGDALFALAQLARSLRQNPEESLQKSNRKFLSRFRLLEQRSRRESRPLKSLTGEEMDAWWEALKRES